MMRPAPRIIAIDDEPKHLSSLTDSLNRYGATCMPVHFTGDTSDLRKSPHVRIIFADLHLNGTGSGSEHRQNFAVIGGLIETAIIPTGPYIVVLWTRFADQANALQDFLVERLQDVQKPLAVAAIDKMVHLDTDGNVRNIEKLVQEVDGIVGRQPQIAAILNWEERILGAAAETVSSIVRQAEAVEAPGAISNEVGRLLAKLAVAAVGQEHVDRDRFHAVNEGLLPILADHVATLETREADSEVWTNAFSAEDVVGGLSGEEAARLNRVLLVAMTSPRDSGEDRGAVIPLPGKFSGEAFEDSFGLTESAVAIKQFACESWVEAEQGFRWVLVQSQAACDYAQKQPGTLPFLLGLDVDAEKISKNRSLPQAVWTSPAFEHEGIMRILRVNARFQIALTVRVAAETKPQYRLREHLLADLIHHVHSYGARPGMISLREQKPPKQ